MKKNLLVTLFILMVSPTFAQWYGVSPQVYYDPCVQAAIRAAQSSNRIMQTNQMIMQQQQMMMNNGWYTTPTYNQNNNSSNTYQQRRKREKRVCGSCDGKGWVPETKGVPSFGQTKWCSTCDKKVPSSHYHATCPSCKGTGKW